MKMVGRSFETSIQPIAQESFHPLQRSEKQKRKKKRMLPQGCLTTTQ